MLPKTFTIVALALAAIPLQATIAQTGFIQPLNTDADALATQMRAIAANPVNVTALVTAGELSLKLDDLAAAASFFARAEKVDPRNARMKAGEGALLVRSERPGEALRYFALAESYGQDPRNFAADRGLAYDLIGEQERAQRDYRLALQSRADDETVRRYALSLGISGKREQALQQLAPLIARTDRGAWRSRAFILAMTGDVKGAEKIATTMMPGGVATGLQPFFDRLPTLPAIDRAFAVHFGEVRASPQRIADARLAPAMAALAPEPGLPVQVASVSPVVKASDSKRDEKRKRDEQRRAKAKPGRIELAQAPIPAAARVDLPPAAAKRPQPVQLAQALPPQTKPAVPQPQPRPDEVQPAVQPVQLASAEPSPRPGFAGTAPASTAVTQATEARLGAAASASSASSPAPTAAPASQSTAEAAPAATTALQPVAPEPARVTPPRARSVATAGEDSILAKIIAGLSIPAAELGVSEPQPAAGPAPGLEVSPNAVDPQAAEKLAAEERAAEQLASARKLAAEKAAADKKAAVEKKAAAEKAAADKKALAAKKAAADKKALADKQAAEEKKAAKADPQRIWVQVAGGANENDLPKAWAAVKAKAPQVFAGHQGYSTPLRATNRVVTGPFKTDAEARAFINLLAKKGVSGFSFTSDKGQKIERLSAK